LSNICWASERTWKSTLSFLPFSDILEVRPGTAPDPQQPGKTGTQVLRRTAKKNKLSLSFSLLTSHRSLDIEAKDEVEYSIFMGGFKAVVEKNKEERRGEGKCEVHPDAF